MDDFQEIWCDVDDFDAPDFDDLADEAFDGWIRELFPNRVKWDTWITREYKKIKINKMDDRHLSNTIDLLHRKKITHPILNALIKEANKRDLH